MLLAQCPHSFTNASRIANVNVSSKDAVGTGKSCEQQLERAGKAADAAEQLCLETALPCRINIIHGTCQSN